jgi:hypothetical protein
MRMLCSIAEWAVRKEWRMIVLDGEIVAARLVPLRYDPGLESIDPAAG